MDKLVSIIVPIYNMADSIEKCVQSLVNQDYMNIEIILVDDGSQDNTLSVCKRLEGNDTRIHVFHTENQGSGPARNYGIEVAKGDYIYFPDADDYLEPNAISVLVDAMKNDVDLVVFGYKKITQKNQILSIKEYETRIEHGDVLRNDYSSCANALGKWAIQGAPWNKFFDLTTVKKNNVKYPSLRRHQDEAFISRYMCFAQNVSFIPDVLYAHYVNDLQLEWKKYPVGYIDAVIGLNDVRKATIMQWNANDLLTHDIVKREYICNVIKALELSFSPKNDFSSKKQRIAWMKKLINKSDINNYSMPVRFSMKYQRTVLKLVKNNQLELLYTLLKLKILAEQYFRNSHRGKK